MDIVVRFSIVMQYKLKISFMYHIYVLFVYAIFDIASER